MSGDLRVHGAGMERAHRYSTSGHFLGKFASKHDVGKLAPAVRQSGVVPGHTHIQYTENNHTKYHKYEACKK